MEILLALAGASRGRPNARLGCARHTSSGSIGWGAFTRTGAPHPAGCVARVPTSLSCLCALWASAAVACSSNAAGPTDPMPAAPTPVGGSGGVHVQFELARWPLRFGSVPWPDDLYLDSTGRINLATTTAPAVTTAPGALPLLGPWMQELQGFSPVAPVVFYLDGTLDSSTLPRHERTSTTAHASAFLLDLDPSSNTAFLRMPVVYHWNAARRQLAIQPAPGAPLVPGRKYAAVVTRMVRAADGSALQPSPDFARIRDAETVPQDPLQASAYDHFTPVLDLLEARAGIARKQIAALAVFTVQAIDRDLSDARGILHELPRPRAEIDWLARDHQLEAVLGSPLTRQYGLDQKGGVLHDNIGWMVHGRLRVPNFAIGRAGARPRFGRDPQGRLSTPSFAHVPFTLWLPRGDTRNRQEALPVVLFQHGLGAERSDGLALADALNASGFAVLALDAPMHGLRLARSDVSNRFTGVPVPDLFGDSRGSEVAELFLGMKTLDIDPTFVRDVRAQAVVELMSAVRLLGQGDWSELTQRDSKLEQLSFDADQIGFVGIDLGGELGVVAAANEPALRALVVVGSAAPIVDAAMDSPVAHQQHLSPLLSEVGMDPFSVDLGNDPPPRWPTLVLWQTLLDRSDAAAFSSVLQQARVHVLAIEARHDEIVHNRWSEALGRALGCDFVGTPRHLDTIRSVTAPVSNNYTAGSERATRALFEFAPATHELLLQTQGESRYQHPLEPPFAPKPPEAVSNPIDRALGQLTFFFQSWRQGSTTVVDRTAPPLP
ncbi:MAG: hypothetical protein MJD61_22490 [Proteobacteria bacterium]|nr:hypothetical protein [Pseudomonadota bacterium]